MQKIKMPKLSPTMEVGTIVRWHKKEGDQVQPGDLLIEVATDKATMEYRALDGGWLRKIVVPEGQDAQLRDVIAWVSEDPNEPLPEEEPPVKLQPQPISRAESRESTDITPPQAVAREAAFFPFPPLAERVVGAPQSRVGAPVSPLARAIAKEKNLDLSAVRGSGPGGRIVSSDLESAPQRSRVGFGSRASGAVIPGAFERVPLSPVRRAIAKKMMLTVQRVPHFYVSRQIAVSQLLQVKKDLKEGGIPLSVNDFILRAVVLALQQHPEINSGFDETEQAILRFLTIDLAVATQGEEVLLTPIIRAAEYKNIGELAVEGKQLFERARRGELKPEEFQGGSFTVSNLGMYGVSRFQPIINAPQAAILAVGAAHEVAGSGSVIDMTLAADHRVLDGTDGARFLETLAWWMERPALLLLNPLEELP